MTKSATQVEAEAAAWLARRDGQGWSADDGRRLDAWLAGSTANRIAFLRLETAWSKAERLRAVGAVELPDDPDGRAERAPAAGRRDPLRARRRRGFVALAIAAALAALVVPGWQLLRGPREEVYSTPVGGFQSLPLADGSRVELNTNSKLEVALSADERALSLDHGEAFFRVAHDRGRPFVVTAGDYRVIAVGTAFSVRHEAGAVSVAVTEGRVRIDRVGAGGAGGQLAFLSAGQRIGRLGAAPAIQAASPAQLDQSLSWRDGLLTFENRPLREVAAEFNRYNARQLVVSGSAAEVAISGSFRATNLDGFLRLLGQGFDVRAAPAAGGDRVVLTRG